MDTTNRYVDLRLYLSAIYGDSYADPSASDRHANADSAPHAHVYADAESHAGFRNLPVEARLV